MRRRASPGLGRDRRAATAVEFALVALPMLLLVLGSMEFGRLLWTMQALQATAAESARCMAVLAPPCSSGGTYNAANTLSYTVRLAGGWGIAISTDAVTARRAVTLNGVSGLSEILISYNYQTVLPQLVPAGQAGVRALVGKAYVPNWQ